MCWLNGKLGKCNFSNQFFVEFFCVESIRLHDSECMIDWNEITVRWPIEEQSDDGYRWNYTGHCHKQLEIVQPHPFTGAVGAQHKLHFVHFGICNFNQSFSIFSTFKNYSHSQVSRIIEIVLKMSIISLRNINKIMVMYSTLTGAKICNTANSDSSKSVATFSMMNAKLNKIPKSY